MMIVNVMLHQRADEKLT